MPLIAYHNDPAVKARYLDRVRAHREADELVKGYYWENGKGCAVGCTLHSDDHAAYETELGIPEVLAHLQDAIFEELPYPDAMGWPERFLSAIRPGADLSLVWPRFALWLMIDPEYGVIQYAGDREDVREVISTVAGLYAEWLRDGVRPGRGRFEAAVRAGRATAWAARAARAAWATAGYAARDAARDAARAGTAWVPMADKLVELLEDTNETSD